MDPHLVFRPDIRVDDGEARKIVGATCFFDNGVGVLEDLVDGHGVHLATVVVSGLDGVLKVPASGLGSQVVGDNVTGAASLLDPGQVWHGDPDRTAIDSETDVGGIGVARRDRDDGSLPFAVEGFAGPAVGYLEVFIHGWF